jgi:hypothetical protein
MLFEGLGQRISAVRERIEAAAARSHRNPAEIELIAVTKLFPVDAILEGYEAGLRDFGENYVQEFETKYPAVSHLQGVRFHLIGHLQSNKSKKAAEIFGAIHTVDTAKLARHLNEAATPLDVFIEVKLSHEESKSGAEPSEIGAIADVVRAASHLRLAGLMTVPPWSEDPELSRPYFARLRALAETHGLSGLSMGMSGDLEVAIEEGATCVRVGTALFGRRVKR